LYPLVNLISNLAELIQFLFVATRGGCWIIKGPEKTEQNAWKGPGAGLFRITANNDQVTDGHFS
jgi:hypothetical protein